MTGARGYRTERCGSCGLTNQWCVCAELPRVQNAVAVDIVVHWRELRKPTNTARIAHRMLSSCRILVRGGPEPGAGRDVAGSLAAHPVNRTLLLYPSDDAEALGEARELQRPQTLIVPDGTWAQTRRLIRRQELGRFRAVRLPAVQSQYALRRGVQPGVVCTLEAIAAALDAFEVAGTGDALRAGFQLWQQRALAIRRGHPPATHQQQNSAKPEASP